MNCKLYTYLLLFLYAISKTDIARGFEILSIGATLGMGAVVGFGLIKSKVYCNFKECCDEHYIPGNIAALKEKLSEKVYGQHIVKKHIVQALTAHFHGLSSSRKPLVISFHGQPGTGKNYVADHIAEALYKNGLQSQYVHKFLGRADFPEAKNVEHYRAVITDKVRRALLDCPRSLFIFDEVDKMPSGIFETLSSLADYNSKYDETDNTKAIFIFLSNTAGIHISDHLGNLMKQGTLREDTRLSDFEPLLQKVAYNMDGGLRKTSLIEAHVIDHYIPFLPLEKSHVIKCLVAEFHRWGRKPNDEIISEILTTSITYDRTHGIFAISGCKTLEKKVAMAIN